MEDQPSSGYAYSAGAGVVLLGTAAFHAASVLQLVLMFRQEWPVVLAESMFAFAAVGHLLSGAGLYGGSLRWNLASVAITASGAVLGLSWFLWLFFYFGGFSVLALFCFVASGGSLLVSLMMLRITKRLDDVRRTESLAM